MWSCTRSSLRHQKQSWRNPWQPQCSHDSRGTSMSEQINEQPERKLASFVVTKGYRLFAEMCDACRQDRFVGLGYGPPGTGKTESAKQYAQWSLFKPFLPEPLITFTGRSAVDGLYPYRPLTFASGPLDAPIQECRTVFYTPPVTGAP